MSMPLPPTEKKESGELTENESGFILDATLKGKHRTDSSVISFIDSFVRCKSVAQASAEAGIHASIGHKYRNRQDIATAIQKLMDKSAVKHGFDTSEIFERVKEVVEFDPIMLQNPDGSFKSNMHEIDPEARRSLKKLKVKNLYNQEKDLNGMPQKIVIGVVIEYEFYDKLKAAELAGVEKNMFVKTSKVEHGVTKEMSNLLLESKARAQDRVHTRIVDAVVTDVTPAQLTESE